MKKDSRIFSRITLYDMTLCALFAALLCVLSPLSVPIGPIPVSLGLLGVLLCAATLGIRRGTISVLLFLLLGAVGIPVFSGGGSGFAALAGPTGGYLWGYLPTVAFAGLSGQFRSVPGKFKRAFVSVLFCVAGTLLCYLCGTVQYCAVAGVSFLPALSVCVLPFLPFDLLKCLFAGIFGTQLRSVLAHSERHFSRKQGTGI